MTNDQITALQNEMTGDPVSDLKFLSEKFKGGINYCLR